VKITVIGERCTIVDGQVFVGEAKRVYPVEFVFDDSWDGYTATAVFESAGSEPVSQLLVDGKCFVPWEVLIPNVRFRVGVFGVKDNVERPTIWTHYLPVAPGTSDAPEAQPDPTPGMYTQMLQLLNQHEQAEAIRVINEEARKDAEDVRQDSEAKRATAEAQRVANDNRREQVWESQVLAAGNSAKRAEAAAQRAEKAVESVDDAAVAAVKAVQIQLNQSVSQAQEQAVAAQESAEEAKRNATRVSGVVTAAYNCAAEAGEAATFAQQSQASAEQSAAAAKESANHPPIPNEEGFWMLWNPETKQYENSPYETTVEAAVLRAEAAEDNAVASAAASQASAESAKASETSAANSAEEAAKSAESMNAEELNSRIAAKADNLEFDAETSLLWLLSGGERIGDGIKVATSGGGGVGGESNNAQLSLNSTTGWIYKTISEGAPVSVAFTWSSIENGLETGAGVLKISVNGTVKHTEQIKQGDYSKDISSLLSAVSNAVKVNVTDVYGNSRSLSYNLTVVSLVMSSSFDATVAYTGEFVYPYTPTAAVEKTVHIKVDGSELPTVTVVPSGRQQTYTIPAQAHGAHKLETWFTAMVEGEEVESNHLYHTVICTEAGNMTPIIAVDWRASQVEQFETLNIPYIVYDPASLTATVNLHSSETG
jgi:hypothetical protein